MPIPGWLDPDLFEAISQGYVTMRVAVIINPISGARGHPETARRRVKLAAGLLTAEGIEHEVCLTERAGHAYDLARGAIER